MFQIFIEDLKCIFFSLGPRFAAGSFEKSHTKSLVLQKPNDVVDVVFMISNGETVNLSVQALGINGEGVAKLDGCTVFVDGALPNENIFAKISTVKSNYAKAKLLKINSRDKDRIEPSCTRFYECGGCQIMHLGYEAQLFRKTQLVKDALKHIGGCADALVLPCISSGEPFYYRNKIQLPVADNNGQIVTGFYRRYSHEVVPYERCLIHHYSMEDTVLSLRNLIQSSGLIPYSETTKNGTLRHIIIRANNKGEQLIGLVTTGKQKTVVQKFAQVFKQAHHNIVGVVESINIKAHNSILGDKTIALAGESYLMEELNGLCFKVSLPSFFQVNLMAAKKLYDIALSLAEIDNKSTVLDAYCGIGTMSLLSARLAKKVIGVECVPQAITDAKENAHLNKITNVEFLVGKVEDNVEIFKGIDIALVNPPRKGLDSKISLAINDFGPKTLVYISCNPATLARDIRLLTNYQLIKVQPVDMFPQTMHVESVALLKRAFS